MRDLDLRMVRNARTGDVKLIDGPDAVNQRLGNYLMTRFLEIPYEPLVGSEIGDTLFENKFMISSVLQDIIEDALRDAFPELEFVSISIHDDTPNSILVAIFYRILPEDRIYEYEMKLRLQ